MKKYAIVLFSVGLVFLPLLSYLPIGIFKEDIIVCFMIIFFLLSFSLGLFFDKKNKYEYFQFYISKADVWIMTFAFYTLIKVSIERNETKVNELTIYKMMLLFIIYIYVRIYTKPSIILKAIIIGTSFQAIIVIAQKVGYIESGHHFFDVTGSFDNPGQVAGYMSIGAMITTSFYNKEVHRNHIMKVILYAILFIIHTIALYYADSRASFIAFTIGIVYIWYHDIIKVVKKCRSILIPIILLCSIMLCIYLFLRRPASVKARFLIWRTSLNMFANKPIFGHGIGAFNKTYMLYQAEYFKTHPNSHFIYVANNVSFPYNEILRIGIEWGGLGMLIILLCFKVIFYRRCSEQDIIVKGGLITLLTFSMFSYPFEILPMLLFFPILMGLSKSECNYSNCFKKKSIKGLQLICLIGGGICLNTTCFYVNLSLHMKNILHNDSNLIFKQEIITRLLPNVKFTHFLAYYIKLNAIDFNESFINYLPPTCETYCFYGDYYKEKGLYKHAEFYYQTASNMIPTRITPHYKLWKLYVSQNNIIIAIREAQYILQQELKVENSFTLKVKAEIRTFLKNIRYDK